MALLYRMQRSRYWHSYDVQSGATTTQCSHHNLVLPTLFFLILIMLVVTLGACSFTMKVKTGMQAYEVKQYAVAARLFEQEYDALRNRQDQALVAYLTGESYLQLNDPASAAMWYRKAHDHGYGAEALERYASTLRQQERYDEAIGAYEELLAASPGNARIRSMITICRQAKDWKANPVADYSIEPIQLNTSAGEYCAVPLNQHHILFTSDRESKSSSGTYLWTGRAYSDLFLYNKLTKSVISFDNRINSADNDGNAALSPDGQLLVFTRCAADELYDAWCRLMVSRKQENGWGTPEPLPFCKPGINYGHPAFAANGVTLFFASNDPAGKGGHDIYFVQLQKDDTWSEPINAGPEINTIGNEMYPSVYRDTLFFSSDHHPGLGGLDIFKTWLMENNRWASPMNLKAPINSGADEFAFVIDTFTPVVEGVLLQGYFTTNRGGASRGDDIYAFTLHGQREVELEVPDPDEEADTPVIELPRPQLFLILQVAEPVFARPGDPNSDQTGTSPLPNGPVMVAADQNEVRQVTDGSGQLITGLEWDKNYQFTARYRDHLSASWEIDTRDIQIDSGRASITIRHTLLLQPIVRNTEIILRNIFYDLDQWTIREDARPALNELAAMLKANPGIRVQLSAHTDCRATDDYNRELSQKRAQSAMEYLISKGIAPERLVARGYGETMPAVDCICEQCTEEEHQANRRTTFMIID